MPPSRRRVSYPAIALLAIAPAIAQAQTPSHDDGLDEVILRDGTRIKGRVVEESQGGFVVIETPDRRRRTVPHDLVREVNVAPRSPSVALSRDGGVLSYELRAQIHGVFFPTQTYPVTGTCATGSGVAPVSIYGQTANGRGAAGGAGIGGRLAYMHTIFPKRGDGTSWWGFRVGSGIDLGFLYGHLPTGVPQVAGDLCAAFEKQSHDVDYTSDAMFLLQVPLNAGAHVGIGSFREGTTWRGVVLGAAWSPTLTYVKPSQSDTHTTVSYLGVEVTLDFTTLDTAIKRRAEQHFRVAAVLLPPTSEGAPFVTTLSLGAVWY